MILILWLLLFVAPYLLFWLIWWRYARHYERSFRIPHLADLHQAWALTPMVSYGITLRRIVVTMLLAYYVLLHWLIFVGL